MENLQKQLDILLPTIKGKHLLLHSCCAPCSSYVLEYLSEYFTISLLFYNPNILPNTEYQRRLTEQKRLLSEISPDYPIKLLEVEYQPADFLSLTKGYENEPEGGDRCTLCYRLRLEEAARVARDVRADYFTTTLSISPHKDAKHLGIIALEMGLKYGVTPLPSDFKKRNGYQRSIQLSKDHNLYRQDWCGCPFSKAEKEARQKQQSKEEKRQII